ncbi:probable LRR receptor-like serine/threonine-protein kinase At5g37450 [Cannabis sativa]|uniref:probable LRR receptor-like serine/threonine-protein kinase At5g37450 n=1 Tax=Cannabis sativa TaxID=3483 RepID=UPI0029CA59FE|nr:probable LRR receptor-like serine/threonine-protein kinase At5g37450 [Cannabis sativa]
MLVFMARLRICIFGPLLIWISCCCTLLVYGQITHPLEVNALKAVHRQLIDPLGRLKNWRKKDPCTSLWTGLFCTNTTYDGYYHVKELRLLNMNLSGTLAPELGQFKNMTILNFMWNNISGSIPKEIGSMTSLKLLLLSGNEISGPLPDELGNLSKLTKFQLDINRISGPIPKSFAYMPNVQHFHMNNNSISGQIPPELSNLPSLVHFLLDNNNLSGYLPPELSMMKSLKILQVNNNNFSGTEIPDSYANMSQLLKLTLRNCNLQGRIPDFSSVPGLFYLDLSSNQLSGSIPTNKLSDNITTIDLSKNKLDGPIPESFTGFPKLQRLSLENNSLNGTIPSTFWRNIFLSTETKLSVNLQHNLFSNLSGSLYPPSNVTIMLQGNPICTRANEQDIVRFCGQEEKELDEPPRNSSSSLDECKPQSCPKKFYEYVPNSPTPCFCAAPMGVGIRLRSPSIWDFRPYVGQFQKYMADNLLVEPYQLDLGSFIWQEGPRLLMLLKVFPQYNNNSNELNTSELQRVMNTFATFAFPSNDIFGPYDLLNFTLLGPYKDVIIVTQSGSGMNKRLLVGIVLGAISCGMTVLGAIAYLISRNNEEDKVVKRKYTQKAPSHFDSVKGFSFVELEIATDNFNMTSQVGQGGYGKVYKGILADGTVVAVKRAQQASLQGEREFFTEIELLSRVHHRNLVSLVGFCEEDGEQMLVYEFMANGSLYSLLSARFRSSLTFARRMQIALDSAKGILYLHTEADPPIIHRDIKSNNILLDSKFTAKVSDFGISKLAPVPDGKGETRGHVSTVVKGTPGYLDPDYFLTHKLTDKSDVYSIGIVFLELLTGMPPISHGRNIVREVNTACQSGNMETMIDRDMGSYNFECVKKFMQLALKCCQEEAKGRPTMLEVVRELENLCSMLSQSKTSHSDFNASSSTSSASVGLGLTPSPNYDRNMYMTTDYAAGSNLVSGVFPDIRPR